MQTAKLAAVVTAILSSPAVTEASYGKAGPADTATLSWIIILGVASAVVGKRMLNRVSAVFLGGVGGTIAAGMWHNLTGAALGLLVGCLVAALPWFSKPAKAHEPEPRIAA